MMLRLLPETPQEPFALWEILNKDNNPLVGLILDSESELFAFLLLYLPSFSLLLTSKLTGEFTVQPHLEVKLLLLIIGL